MNSPDEWLCPITVVWMKLVSGTEHEAVFMGPRDPNDDTNGLIEDAMEKFGIERDEFALVALTCQWNYRTGWRY